MVTNNATNNLKGTTITGTSNQISVSNGDGVSGVPTLSLSTTQGNFANSTRTVFIASLSGDVTNATGDNTVYTIAFDTVTQQGSAFNTGTNTFTVPTTGYYVFTEQVALGNLAAGHTSANTAIVQNATVLNSPTYNPNAVKSIGLGYVLFSSSRTVFCTAGDTIVLKVVVSGSTKTVTVLGSITSTLLTGFYLCGS